MIGTIGAIAIGGGLGAASRFGFNALAVRMLGTAFPWGTLLVNIVGSFLMGLAAAKFTQSQSISEEMRAFITTGLLGGFTTFSAFSLDFVTLWERGEITSATIYMLASVVFSTLGLIAGMMLMRGLMTP